MRPERPFVILAESWNRLWTCDLLPTRSPNDTAWPDTFDALTSRLMGTNKIPYLPHCVWSISANESWAGYLWSKIKGHYCFEGDGRGYFRSASTPKAIKTAKVTHSVNGECECVNPAIIGSIVRQTLLTPRDNALLCLPSHNSHSAKTVENVLGAALRAPGRHTEKHNSCVHGLCTQALLQDRAAAVWSHARWAQLTSSQPRKKKKLQEQEPFSFQQSLTLPHLMLLTELNL